MNVLERLKPKPKELKEKKPKPPKIDTNALTRAVIDYVNYNGGYAMRVNTQGQYDSKIGGFRKSGSTKGISDILFCYKGLFFAIEIKTGKDKLNPSQIAFKANFEKAGGKFFECRNIESFIAYFNEIKNDNIK